MCGYPCGCNYGGSGIWIIIVVLLIFFVIFWGNGCNPGRCNN